VASTSNRAGSPGDEGRSAHADHPLYKIQIGAAMSAPDAIRSKGQLRGPRCRPIMIGCSQAADRRQAYNVHTSDLRDAKLKDSDRGLARRLSGTSTPRAAIGMDNTQPLLRPTRIKNSILKNLAQFDKTLW